MERGTITELEKVQNEFDEFAYIVSHDLKAPLRAITNITHWIEEDFGENIDEDVRYNFDLLRQRVERMNKMIDALTQYSRISRREIDVAKINIKDTLESIKEEIGLKYKCEIQIDTKVVEVNTYKNKLYKALYHLIHNAVAHNVGKDDLLVTIEVLPNNGMTKYIIRDNGVGIPEYAKDKIFQLFYTAKGKTDSPHIGSGLALVKKIVDFVNGDLSFTSSANYTEFIVNWPEHS